MIESHANELPERTVNNLAIIDERARVGSWEKLKIRMICEKK